MELVDKEGIRYVLEDKYLQVWNKNKRGCELYEYQNCYPKAIKDSKLGNCILRVDTPGKKSIRIVMKKNEKPILQKFYTKLEWQINKHIKNSNKNIFKETKENCQSNVDEPKQNQTPNRIKCPQCSGENINIQIIQGNGNIKGKSEILERSALNKAGNKAGRTAMIAMTGGLWALTPKKSDFIEKNESISSFQYKKICICQQCGNSWEIK